MDTNSQNVLTEAKYEYTARLQSFLTPPIYSGLRKIYELAKKHALATDQNVIKTFQVFLSKIPKWDDVTKSLEYENVLKSCSTNGCDYLDELVTAVFVTHAKILTSLKTTQGNSEINFDVPKPSYLIHKIYIQCARNFWRQPWLLHTEYRSLDLQKNGIASEKLIKESIEESIRNLLPVKNILKQYLGSTTQAIEDYDDDITSTVSQRTKANIRSLMQHEFGNTIKIVSEDDEFSKLSISEPRTSDTILNGVISPSQNERSIEDGGMDDDLNRLLSDDQQNSGNISHDVETIVVNDAFHDVDEIEKKFAKQSDTDALVAENFDNRTVGEFSVIESDLADVPGMRSGSVVEQLQTTFSFFDDAADF